MKTCLTTCGDTNQYGLIIWTGIKDIPSNKKKINKAIDEIVAQFNRGHIKKKRKKP